MIISSSRIGTQLTTLILNASTLRLMLTHHRLRRTNINISGSTIRMVRLSMNLRPSLLLTTRNTTYHKNRYICPLPANVRHIPLINGLPIVNRHPPIKRRPNIRIFLLYNGNFTPNRRLILLYLRHHSRLELYNVLHDLPNFRYLRYDLNNNEDLLNYHRLHFRDNTLFYLYFTLNFRLFFTTTINVIFNLTLLRIDLYNIRDVVFLNRHDLRRTRNRKRQPLKQDRSFKRGHFNVLPRLNATLLLPHRHFPHNNANLLYNTINLNNNLLNFIRLRFNKNNTKRINFNQIINTTTSETNNSLFRHLDRRAHLHVRGDPFRHIANEVNLNLSTHHLPMNLLHNTYNNIPILTLYRTPNRLIRHNFPLNGTNHFNLRLRPTNINVNRDNGLYFENHRYHVRHFRHFTPNTNLNKFRLNNTSNLNRLSNGLLPLTLYLLYHTRHNLWHTRLPIRHDRHVYNLYNNNFLPNNRSLRRNNRYIQQRLH